MNITINPTRVLCYGDSNTWGWVPGKMGAERYNLDIRWPGVMQAELGLGYEVIEDALGARTTNLDEPRPELPLRNGLQTLSISLESHAPIDVLVFMLGTADCKPLFDVPTSQITDGMEELIMSAKNFKAINGKVVRHIVLIAPPIIDDKADFAQKVYANSRPKTVELVGLYRDLAAKHDCHFVDSNQFVRPDSDEGIHITAESHQALGSAVAAKLQQLAGGS